MKDLGQLIHKKILLVDDEPQILMMVSEILLDNGFKNIVTAQSYQSAMSLFEKDNPDLAILDVMLPDGNGFDLMKEMRAVGSNQDLPILFLTAKDTDEDIVHGLGLGADDYIVKPFNRKELLFRVINILKRYYKGEMKQVQLRNCSVDLEKAIVIKDGLEIHLTATEFKIFQYLFENANRIMTSDQIIAEVWGHDSWSYENSLMAHVSRLRQKIEEDPANPQSLITIRGLGYQLNTRD